MILCNGRAIFHEKRAERSLKGIRAGSQEAPGNRGFRAVGTETQEQRATEVQEDRIETGEAPGNRSFEGLGRVSGVPGNRHSRRTGSEGQAAAGNRGVQETRRIQGGNGQPESSGNRKRISGTLGDWSSEGAPGDRGFQEERGDPDLQRNPGNWKSLRQREVRAGER